MKRRNLFAFLICFSLVAVLGCSLGGLLHVSMSTPLAPTPPSFSGPWTDPDYPTGKGWLLYPNGGEAVSGMVTIQWNTSKTPRLDPNDVIEISWSHEVRGGAAIYGLGNWPYSPYKFEHEDWEGCYCSDYTVITRNAPNTGSYEWNASEVLEQCSDEWYPFYLKIMGGVYMDASNTYFNITRTLSQSNSLSVPLGSSAEADGYIEPDEYDDALEVDLSNATWEAYLYLKHDSEFLYIFIDHVSDTRHNPMGYDNGWIAIDTLSDGGDAPKEDDYLFHSSGHHIWIGNGPYQIPGGQWEELMGHGETPPELENKLEPFLGGRYAASGPGAFGLSQNSLTPHSIFEIKIPITGWEIENKTSFGFCVAAGSPGTDGDFLAKAVWPKTTYDNYTGDFYTGGYSGEGVFEPPIGSFSPPSTWGTIRLVDVGPSPEEGITAPLAKVEAIANGFISPGEWDDAEVVVVGHPDSYGYLYVKHNWTVLWVFLDHVTDTAKSPLGWDNGWVAMDKNMDGGDIPKEDDLLFHEAGHGVWIGDGISPIPGSLWGTLIGHGGPPPEYQDLSDFIAPFFAGSGPSWGTTEASDTLHAYCEMQVPLNWLEGVLTFGFAASMQDHDTTTIIDWPETKSTGNFWPGPDAPSGSYAPPDSWGTLTLDNAPLDEKPPLPPPPPPPPPPPLDVFEIPWDDKTFYVAVDSNSNVSDFYFSQPEKEIGFNVTGSYGTNGFCNVTIPIELLDGAFTVRIDNLNAFYMLTRNETHTSLYFLYSHSTHSVQIIGTIAVPELPPFLILPLFMIATLLAIIVYRKKCLNKVWSK